MYCQPDDSLQMKQTVTVYIYIYIYISRDQKIFFKLFNFAASVRKLAACELLASTRKHATECLR